MGLSPLEAALKNFEEVEALIVKLEKALGELAAATRRGRGRVQDEREIDQKKQECSDLTLALPFIYGWKPDIRISGFLAFEVDPFAEATSESQ